ISSRMSPTVQSRSRPSTMLRLLLGSASIASTAPGCDSLKYLITIAEIVVLPTPPLPANAIVVVIIHSRRRKTSDGVHHSAPVVIGHSSLLVGHCQLFP